MLPFADKGGFPAIPLARYRLEWRVTAPIRRPDYAGSLLRGAFGHALRQTACMTRHKECTGCALLRSCPYPAIFAPPPPAEHALQRFSAIPAPYVIEPPAWGARILMPEEPLVFHLVLVGRALEELPLILLAWRRAFARGVGPGDGTAQLERVVHCRQDGETEIHRPAEGTILPHEALLSLADAAQPESPGAVTLEFHTPLRLQENGRALPPERLNARILLMALARRVSLLLEFHTTRRLDRDFTALRQAAEGIVEFRDLVWRDWTRYSSRQGQKMALGGVVGSWRLEGDLEAFLPYLILGQWLHVGKEAVFGLGRYTTGASVGRHKSGASGSPLEDNTHPADLAKETP